MANDQAYALSVSMHEQALREEEADRLRSKNQEILRRQSEIGERLKEIQKEKERKRNQNSINFNKFSITRNSSHLDRNFGNYLSHFKRDDDAQAEDQKLQTKMEVKVKDSDTEISSPSAACSPKLNHAEVNGPAE